MLNTCASLLQFYQLQNPFSLLSVQFCLLLWDPPHPGREERLPLPKKIDRNLLSNRRQITSLPGNTSRKQPKASKFIIPLAGEQHLSQINLVKL